MEHFKSKIVFRLPTGWYVKESLTLMPLGPELVNLVASSCGLPEPVIDATRYAELQSTRLSKDCPGYRELAFEPAEVSGGRRGYIRLFEWEPQGVPPVTQLELYYVEDAREYTATATATSAEFHYYEMLFRKLLSGLACGRGMSPSGGPDQSTISVPLPKDWTAKESLTLLAPLWLTHPNYGAITFVASGEPVSRPGIDSEIHAMMQADSLRELRGYRELAFKAAEVFGGCRGYIRLFERAPQDNPPVTQLQVYYVYDERTYCATATAESGDFDQWEMEFRHMLSNLRLDTGP